MVFFNTYSLRVIHFWPHVFIKPEFFLDRNRLDRASDVLVEAYGLENLPTDLRVITESGV